jgi:hypothetical protein
MINKSVRYFLAGQLCLYLGILVCIFISPEALFANDGISYYSAQTETVLPYSIGLLLTAWFSYKVALSSKTYPFINLGFNSIALLLIIMVAVPYGASYILAISHTFLSILLFLVQFLLAIKLSLSVSKDLPSLILLITLAVVSITTVRYLSPQMGFLLHGEVLFQLIFGLIVYRAFTRISKTSDLSQNSNRIKQLANA